MTSQTQRRIGRPPGSGFADPIPMRFTPEQLAAVDAWREQQDVPPSRTEAIRYMLSDWLIGQGALAHREDPEGAN